MRSMLPRNLAFSLMLLPGLVIAQEATPVQATTEVAAPAEAAAPVAEAAPVPETAPVAEASPAEAPAPAEASTGLIGAAPEGKGQIVFFRPSKMMGAAIGFKVREGETELGKLRNGRYFIAAVEPGTHEYTVHSETKDVLTLEVEAGETYFVQGTLSMGVLAGRPNLSPSDQATFDGMSKKLKLAN